MGNARNLMDSFPGAKMLSEGVRLRYLLSGKGENILELGRSTIVFSFSSEKPNKQERNENFVKLLAILGYLKNVYDVKLESLYGEIIDAIESASFLPRKEKKSEQEELLVRRITEISTVNSSIAHEMMKQKRRISELEQSERLFARFCYELIDRLSHERLDSEEKIVTALSKLEIEGELVENISKRLLKFNNK